MAFPRPTLTDLRAQVAQAIAAAVPGSDPFLRFSNMGVLGEVLAGLAHLHYGYLDWISLQSVPYTATDEYIEAWGALKGVVRLPASRAVGSVTFTGTNGTVIPSGTPFVRGDGKTFKTTAGGTISGGSVVVVGQADADPSGLTGAWGNMTVGTAVSLGVSIVGANAAASVTTAFTGGADLESDESLRVRVFAAFQQPVYGGAKTDYLRWAREVAGVTRAWCLPHVDGAGSVALYVMLDEAQAAFGGFPQGTNGAATSEARASAATGDQLAVANYIFPLQPVTHLVRVYAPVANPVAFTITGLSSASVGTKNAVKDAIAQVFRDYGAVGSTTTTVPLSLVQSAIAAVPNTTGFLITTPAGNITSAAGQLPTLGVVTFP